MFQADETQVLEIQIQEALVIETLAIEIQMPMDQVAKVEAVETLTQHAQIQEQTQEQVHQDRARLAMALPVLIHVQILGAVPEMEIVMPLVMETVMEDRPPLKNQRTKRFFKRDKQEEFSINI